jgi:hypothetical protein
MKVYFNTSHNEMIFTFCAAVVAIGILSGRLACGNGNEKTLVLQWTNKKSKARKNKLIVITRVIIALAALVQYTYTRAEKSTLVSCH